jgi:hypothetical protein
MIAEERKADYQRNKTEKLKINHHRRDSSGDFDNHVASNAITNFENNATKSVTNKKTESIKNTKSYETRLMRSVHYSGGFNKQDTMFTSGIDDVIHHYFDSSQDKAAEKGLKRGQTMDAKKGNKT